MNCMLSKVTFTGRDDRVASLENVFLRGSQIRFIQLPEILKDAPIFKKVAAAQAKAKPFGKDRARGRGTCSRVASAMHRAGGMWAAIGELIRTCVLLWAQDVDSLSPLRGPGACIGAWTVCVAAVRVQFENSNVSYSQTRCRVLLAAFTAVAASCWLIAPACSVTGFPGWLAACTGSSHCLLAESRLGSRAGGPRSYSPCSRTHGTDTLHGATKRRLERAVSTRAGEIACPVMCNFWMIRCHLAPSLSALNVRVRVTNLTRTSAVARWLSPVFSTYHRSLNSARKMHPHPRRPHLW